MSFAARTLLQLAGAPLHPSPLENSVLLLIDAQEEYRHGRLPLAGIDSALAACATLLDLARSRAVPVFHIFHQGKTGGLFDPAEGGAILPDARPRDGETVIGKTLPNAFAKTELDARLRATGRGELIIAASRVPSPLPEARVIAPPQGSGSVIRLKLCREDGSAAEQIYSKRDGAAFKWARRADWGDAREKDSG